MNFVAQFRWATSHQAHIANSRRDSTVGWSGWNVRTAGRLLDVLAINSDLMVNEMEEGRKRVLGNHGQYSGLASSKDDGRSA